MSSQMKTKEPWWCFPSSPTYTPCIAPMSARNETGDGRFHKHSPRTFAGPVCDPPVAHARQTFAAKFLDHTRHGGGRTGMGFVY